MKVLKFILFISILSFIYNGSCKTTIPYRRSDCHNATPDLLNFCCYFKGIELYSKVETVNAHVITNHNQLSDKKSLIVVDFPMV